MVDTGQTKSSTRESQNGSPLMDTFNVIVPVIWIHKARPE